MERLFLNSLEESKEREKSLPFEKLLSEVNSGVCFMHSDNRHAYLKSLFPKNKINIIAEIKRKSPSKGVLGEVKDVGSLAKEYVKYGAKAVSVLTSKDFGGSLDDLILASKNAGAPTLRKDFVASKYQAIEAKAAGAQFILLIVSYFVQNKDALKKLYDFCLHCGLIPFMECYNKDEIDIAGELNPDIILINTRNLHDFSENKENFANLSNYAKKNADFVIAASSVKAKDDVLYYAYLGADAILIGEALIKGGASLIEEFIN